MIHVICIGLVLEVGSFFRVSVLVGHTEIEGRMLESIGKILLVVVF